MIVKFFKHGKSQQRPTKAVRQAVNYVTGTEVWNEAENRLESRSVAPVVLRGDVGIWSEIVGHGNHAGRYTSGVLRFAEKQVDESTQQAIIDDFEKTLLPGLDADQYSSLWVRHEDKGSVELHFMVAGEELSTGKRLNAYYHKADSKRVNAWKDAINAEYNLADPNDPNRRRSITTARNLPKERKEIVSAIDAHITNLVIDGEIVDRKGIIRELEQMDLEVCRETKTSISIKDPENGKNIRLRGAVYERDFRAADYSTKRIQERAREYSENRKERAEEARKLCRELCEKRSELNRKKYKKSIIDEGLSADFSNNHIAISRSDGRNIGDNVLAKQDLSNNLGGEQKPDFMPRNRRKSAGTEVVQTTIKKEKENESDAERNARIYEEFWERVRKKREQAALKVQRVIGAFREVGKRAGDFAGKLQRNIDQLQRNNEAILEHSGREQRAERTLESLRESIEIRESKKGQRFSSPSLS